MEHQNMCGSWDGGFCAVSFPCCSDTYKPISEILHPEYLLLLYSSCWLPVVWTKQFKVGLWDFISFFFFSTAEKYFKISDGLAVPHFTFCYLLKAPGAASTCAVKHSPSADWNSSNWLQLLFVWDAFCSWTPWYAEIGLKRNELQFFWRKIDISLYILDFSEDIQATLIRQPA